MDSLSPAYRRRLERAQARGLSRQEARGHRPGEYRRRAERELEEEGITGDQARSIRAWVARLNNSDIDADDVVERAKERGYQWFQSYRDLLNEARRRYRAQIAGGTYIDGGEEWLDALADLADVDDTSWVYYH